MRFKVYIVYHYSSNINAPQTHVLVNQFYTTYAIFKMLCHEKAISNS